MKTNPPKTDDPRRYETRMKTFSVSTVIAAGLAISGSLISHAAHADPSLADRSTATQLFKEGRALLDQGHVSAACRKLEESQRIEPGGGTLLNLALCHEREGRSATAWVEFTEALGIAKRDERPQRVEFARTHLAALEPGLSRLVIQVPGSADLPDLEILRDGAAVGRAAWGSPVPVDPGDHLVEATSPGKISWKQAVTVGPKADTKSVVVPVLEVAPVADEAASPQRPARPSGAGFSVESADPGLPHPATKPVAERSPTGSTVNLPAWISTGLGVVAAGVGTYFAFHAISQKSDADRQCPGDACSAQGSQQTSEAIKSANFATVGLGVGVVGLAFGAVLLVTGTGAHVTSSPTPAQSASAAVDIVSAGPLGAGVRVSTAW
jgi:hypothetical protein